MALFFRVPEIFLLFFLSGLPTVSKFLGLSKMSFTKYLNFSFTDFRLPETSFHFSRPFDRLVHYILLRHKYPMLVIRSDDRNNYLKVLHQCDLLTGKIPCDGAHATLQ